jgi:starch phosphorylase
MLALNASHFVNGVAKRHGEVTREMFAGYPIDSVTNGVHSRTWTCAAFQKLFDAHVPGWVNDPFVLRHAVGIPKTEVWEAHAHAKWELVQELGRRGKMLSTEALTLGFARRATPYKRADLLLADPRELVETAREVGPLQIVYAGKAHPRDEAGKELIRRIVSVAGTLDPLVRVVYLENYDLELAKVLTAGVDVWVNTPLRPLEASGTSGMKAAHNGVPSLSVLDGWWIEGHIEGVTGWGVGPQALSIASSEEANRRDGEDLYRKLRAVVAPTFYQDRERWTEIMRQTITFNASFFNTHRMAQQYAAIAYV